jgi:ATP-dependent DNA ligase
VAGGGWKRHVRVSVLPAIRANKHIAAIRFDSLADAFYVARVSLRPRALPAGFIVPCLPTSAPQPPSGALWLHEIKHDGFRVIARKVVKRVKLYSRPGNDLTWRFPLIVEAVAKLRVRCCIIDGERVACGEDGLSSFDRIRHRRYDESVFMWPFDLIEFDGDDLRLEPLGARKANVTRVLARAAPGLRLNEHMMPASSVSRARVEAGGFALQVRPLATLDQEQEPERAVGYAARRIGTCL